MSDKNTFVVNFILTVSIMFSLSLITGCSDQQNLKDDSKPAVNWKQQYDHAWTLFIEKRYVAMVDALESTKEQAKAESGATSIDWGNYLTRLARAHYYAKEAPVAASYAEEAVSILNKAKAPASNRFSADYFAGVSEMQIQNFDKAIPRLRDAINLSRETDPGDTLKLLYEDLISCYKAKNDGKNVAKLQKEMAQRLAHK